jgi:hypothetical protein
VDLLVPDMVVVEVVVLVEQLTLQDLLEMVVL